MSAKNAGIAIIAVALLAALLAFLTGGNQTQAEPIEPAAGPGDGSSSTSSAPPAEFDWSILVVKTTTVNCLQLVKDANLPDSLDATSNFVKFRVSSLVDSVPPRMYTDAISTPFAETSDPVKARTELLVNICRDPHLGYAWANTLANWTPQGHNVGDLNADWLAQYKGSPEQIRGWTERNIMYEGQAYTAEQQQKVAEAYPGYIALAEKIGTLLNMVSPAVEQNRAAESALQLDPLDLVVGRVRNVAGSPHPDTLPALTFSITRKEVCGDLGAVGANLQDKRPEVFAANTCAPPPAAPETPPAGNTPATETTAPPPAPGTETPPPAPSTETPPPPGTETPPPSTSTPPTTTDCNCPNTADAPQPVPTPATQDYSVPAQEPSAQPTVPLDTQAPAQPTPGGYDGGSTQNPITDGPPATADTGVQSTAISNPWTG